MEPIYFPFTYIPNATIQVLSECFKTTAVYQPSNGSRLPDGMQKWVDQEIIRVHVPVQGDESRLAQVCRSYYDWANLHQGALTNFLRTAQNEIPLFEETSAFRLRAEIGRAVSERGAPHGGQGQKTVESSEDLLFKARLFLQMAQEYDIQCRDIQSELRSLDKMQHNLFKNLKGDAEELGELIGEDENDTAFACSMADNATEYRIEDRLAAWTQLLRRDAKRSAVFITSSRAAIEYILEKMPQVRRVADFPIHTLQDVGSGEMNRLQENLVRYLETLTNGGSPESVAGLEKPDMNITAGNVSLTLYLASGKNPLDFFSSCVDGNDFQAIQDERKSEYKNTVLGLIEY